METSSGGCCMTCRFSDDIDQRCTPCEGSDMTCKRYPPTVIGRFGDEGLRVWSDFPMVSAMDWCGEWRPRDDVR